MALKKAVPAAQASAGVNFGSLDMYVAGGGLPEGDYIWTSLDVCMYQAKTQAGVARGPARLGVMITLLPLHDPKPENERTQFYSFGSNADKSFVPNDTGKGLALKADAQGNSLNNQTNWAFLLKSLYDCGLPAGVFINDTSVLEGAWVHMHSIDEPEERKGFQSATAEVQEERKAGKISIVTEIKEGGEPWAGGGGIPATGKANGAATVAAPVPVRKTVGQQAPPAAATEGDDEIRQAAADGIYAVLSKNPNGMPRLTFKNEVFKAVKSAASEDMAGAVIANFFEPSGQAQLSVLLGENGYTVSGPQVKPA